MRTVTSLVLRQMGAANPHSHLITGSNLWVQNSRLDSNQFLKAAFQVGKEGPPPVPQLPLIYLGCKLAQRHWQVKRTSSLLFGAREGVKGTFPRKARWGKECLEF